MTNAYDWTGPIGDVWAAEWRRTDRSFAALAPHLDAAIAAAAPSRHFRALDIGCGAGGTTLALAEVRPDADIIGIDLSPTLIEVARERLAAAALPRRWEPSAPGQSLDNPQRPPAQAHDGIGEGITFLTADVATTARDHGPFDLLYSRHGVMFFDDPVAAFTALHAAAAPGARLVFSCFRAMADNVWARELVGAGGGTIAPSAVDLAAADPPPGPFAFADPARVAAILAASGWRDATPTPVDFAYRVGDGDDPLADALAFLRRIGPAAPLLRAAAPEDRPALLDRITAVLTARNTGTAIDFPAAAWIWSATA